MFTVYTARRKKKRKRKNQKRETIYLLIESHDYCAFGISCPRPPWSLQRARPGLSVHSRTRRKQENRHWRINVKKREKKEEQTEMFCISSSGLNILACFHRKPHIVVGKWRRPNLAWHWVHIYTWWQRFKFAAKLVREDVVTLQLELLDTQWTIICLVQDPEHRVTRLANRI